MKYGVWNITCAIKRLRVHITSLHRNSLMTSQQQPIHKWSYHCMWRINNNTELSFNKRDTEYEENPTSILQSYD